MKLDAILLAGPPGVGKSTQANMLGKRELYHHASTGNMLRDKEYMTDEFARQLNLEGVNKGEYSADEAIVDYFFHVLKKREREGLYVPHRQVLALDGMPRTLRQMDLLEDRIRMLGIIQFTLKAEDLQQRYAYRASSSTRVDDRESSFATRMSIYEHLTAPIIPVYAAKGVPVKYVLANDTIMAVDEKVAFLADTFVRERK